MSPHASRALLRPLAAAIGFALLGGCAQLPENGGFDQVSEQVGSRLDKSLIWNLDKQADASIDAAIGELLAKPLTPDSAVQIALLRSPTLQSRYEELGLAGADLVQSGLLRNPVFHVSYLYPRDGAPPARDFEVGWDFLDVLLIPLRMQRAQQQFEAVQQALTGAVLEHAARTRRAFTELQAAYQLHELTEKRLELAEAAMLVAERLHRIGNITDAMHQRYRMMNTEASLNVARSEAMLAQQRLQLGLLMGVDMSDESIRLGPGLARIPAQRVALNDLDSRALDSNLRLQALIRRLEAAKAEISEAQWKSVLPDLEIGYGWDEEPSGEWKDGPSLEFGLPIFDQGQGKRSRAASLLRRSHADYVAQKQAVLVSAKSIALNLKATREELETLIDSLLPLSFSQADLALLEYNGMQIDVFKLLKVNAEPVAMRERFINTLKTYWLLRTDLDALLAGADIESMRPMTTTSNNAMQDGDGGH